MATKIIAGKTVQVNEEGFMTNPAEWTKEIAVELAKEEGIAELTPAHWKVIDYCRQWAGCEWRQSSDPAHHHHQRRRFHQGAFWPVPQGPGQEGGPHCGSGQAGRLRLIRFLLGCVHYLPAKILLKKEKSIWPKKLAR